MASQPKPHLLDYSRTIVVQCRSKRDQLTNYYTEFIKTNPTLIEAKQLWKQEGDPVIQQLKSVYVNLPATMSTLKQQISLSEKERLIALNGFAAVCALATFRKVSWLNFIPTSFRAFRNAGIAYVALGVFVAPEIYKAYLPEK